MNKLTVVGFGSGDPDNMTLACRQTLLEAQVIVGYTAYVDLVRPLYPDKKFVATPMLGEVERCREALALASQGQKVAVVCSGDAGIYGMASLIYELSAHYPPVDIQVVSGVTAAASGGALLGAPLSHDFVVISLSDLLTPWPLIEKRLTLAAQGDFVICLYNPGSQKRQDYLQKACDLLLLHKSPATICGLARQIGRPDEMSAVMTLAELRDTPVDMFTTVFVGNAATKIIGGAMVTPRGYHYG